MYYKIKKMIFERIIKCSKLFLSDSLDFKAMFNNLSNMYFFGRNVLSSIKVAFN